MGSRLSARRYGMSGIIRTLFRPTDGVAYWLDHLSKL
jgi:hypothetical protein